MSHRLIIIVAWCWIAIPIIPIIRMWSRFYRAIGVGMGRSNELYVLLALITFSYSWLLLGVVFPALIGPDYSSQREGIILSNLLISGTVAAWNWLRARRLRMGLGLAPFATLSVWLYVLLVSSAAP